MILILTHWLVVIIYKYMSEKHRLEPWGFALKFLLWKKDFTITTHIELQRNLSLYSKYILNQFSFHWKSFLQSGNLNKTDSYFGTNDVRNDVPTNDVNRSTYFFSPYIWKTSAKTPPSILCVSINGTCKSKELPLRHVSFLLSFDTHAQHNKCWYLPALS